MPVTKSAEKALRRDRRRKVVNLRIKRKIKAALKSARLQPTRKNLSAAYSALDRAAKKHVIHKNKAARLKSRLMRVVEKLKAKTAKRKTNKKSKPK